MKPLELEYSYSSNIRKIYLIYLQSRWCSRVIVIIRKKEKKLCMRISYKKNGENFFQKRRCNSEIHFYFIFDYTEY